MTAFEWTDSDEWPVASTREFSAGDVTCQCGRSFQLYWNGGELDRHLCACGLFYRTEHREVELVVRQSPPGEMAGRQATCRHGAWSDGLCEMCGKPRG